MGRSPGTLSCRSPIGLSPCSDGPDIQGSPPVVCTMTDCTHLARVNFSAPGGPFHYVSCVRWLYIPGCPPAAPITPPVPEVQIPRVYQLQRACESSPLLWFSSCPFMNAPTAPKPRLDNQAAVVRARPQKIAHLDFSAFGQQIHQPPIIYTC